ncbi:hypothetical protein XI05_16695 [Bradyrhizobium sp. CCBAU 11357]|nr:hypothetical protein [Bradyrhizobium sp. CCBAU 11357]
MSQLETAAARRSGIEPAVRYQEDCLSSETGLYLLPTIIFFEFYFLTNDLLALLCEKYELDFGLRFSEVPFKFDLKQPWHSHSAQDEARSAVSPHYSARSAWIGCRADDAAIASVPQFSSGSKAALATTLPRSGQPSGSRLRGAMSQCQQRA